jgi:hypothetical protein
LQGNLGAALTNRAETWLELGERQKARADAQEAERILKAEIALHGRTDLQNELDRAVKIIKDVT